MIPEQWIAKPVTQAESEWAERVTITLWLLLAVLAITLVSV
jgi:hypothetical protein